MSDVISLKSIQAELAALRADNAALKQALAHKPSGNGMKVSAKGALSIYGLGRFPVTLYRGQWERLLGMKADIEQFILDHASALAVKDAD